MDIVKTKNGKYKITLGDGTEITTYDQVIIDNKLLYAKDIDDVTLSKVIADTETYDIYNKCIKLIEKKMRCKKELEIYVDKIDKDKTSSIISKLENNGFINDKLYIKAYINDKINFSLDGPYKIYKYLKDNELDENLIYDELSKIDNSIFEEKIKKYIDKKAKLNKTSLYQFKCKVLNELINKGYDKEDILKYLDDVKVKSNISTDYKKIYSKLSNKYDGYELERKVKEKLYQKGYSKDEIEKNGF